MGPRLWPYLVITAPEVMRVLSVSHAAFAMAHAAFPMAMSTTRPAQENSCSARCTAASGCTARRLARMIWSAVSRSVIKSVLSDQKHSADSVSHNVPFRQVWRKKKSGLRAEVAKWARLW